MYSIRNLRTVHESFLRPHGGNSLLFRANLQNAAHFVGTAHPPGKILKVHLKMQAFYAHFIKFCLALNSNENQKEMERNDGNHRTVFTGSRAFDGCICSFRL